MRTLAATFVFVFLLALASAPSALAQAPPNPAPAMTVTITGLPAQFAGLTSNATPPDVTFSVDVRLSNVVCPAGGSVPVTLTVTASGAPSFFTVAVDPETGAVNVPQGQYVATPASGSLPAALKLTVGEITDNASVPVEVKASAGTPTGCNGASAIGPAEATAIVYANMTAPTPPPPPTPENNDSPGPGALLGVLAAFGAAALRRRRSD